MATSRPSSRNIAARPASKSSQNECRRNGDVQEKPSKRSNSSRQSQNQSQKSLSQESQRPESSSQKNVGCLEILSSEGSLREILKPIDRPASGSRAKKAPSINRTDNPAPRRTPTPTSTKQIILEAAKRKTESMLTFEETNLTIQRQNETAKNDKVNEPGQRSTNQAKVRAKDEKKEEDDDDDEDDDDEEEEESSSEEELTKAPNELMMEFLDCVLKEDFVNGLKLCKMILLYEPENSDALSFKALIEEKMALDVSNEDDEDEDDEDDEDDDEDDDDEDDDEDDSNEDDSDSTETSEEEDEEEDEKTQTKARTCDRTIFVP